MHRQFFVYSERDAGWTAEAPAPGFRTQYARQSDDIGCNPNATVFILVPWLAVLRDPFGPTMHCGHVRYPGQMCFPVLLSSSFPVAIDYAIGQDRHTAAQGNLFTKVAASDRQAIDSSSNVGIMRKRYRNILTRGGLFLPPIFSTRLQGQTRQNRQVRCALPLVTVEETRTGGLANKVHPREYIIDTLRGLFWAGFATRIGSN